MRKPKIGVMPLWDEKKDSIWMLPGYMDGVREAGGIPVILPLHLSEEDFKEIRDDFDGFLFTGGPDISPALYGEEKSELCGYVCEDRDKLETMVFRYCLERDVPALGICRGLQLFNVLMGGTLYQDIHSERPSLHALEHNMDFSYDWVAHLNTIIPGTPMHDRLGVSCMGVNSLHHQAIKKLASGLVPMAYSEDELIEAVYAPSKKFLWAVQWHPECSYVYDGLDMAIFEAFTEAASASSTDNIKPFLPTDFSFSDGSEKLG